MSNRPDRLHSQLTASVYNNEKAACIIVKLVCSLFAISNVRMKRGDFANLGLFKKNPELLKQGSYTVSSDVNDEVMSAFFGANFTRISNSTDIIL